jgi:hypothetical protein
MFRTAIFTSSSDRQLDTKERRRYELKLSKAPNMRTVIIAVLAFILIGTAVDALAKELRVTTAADLVSCVSGVALAAGPDAGKVAAAGDTCVVFPGTYDLALVGTPADIVIENLTLRSTNGATATIITLLVVRWRSYQHRQPRCHRRWSRAGPGVHDH